jgi:hypothetical protein
VIRVLSVVVPLLSSKFSSCFIDICVSSRKLAKLGKLNKSNALILPNQSH